ncbi:MAG: hypothetical protein KKD74_10990 [Bacteroidetes bacterium]|nr:hypothetical protein [Bacteroidota bacterium]
MKTLKILLVFSTVLIAPASCRKNQDPFPMASQYIDQIIGKYKGSYTLEGQSTQYTAYGEIGSEGGGLISIHCYGRVLDTTFAMQVYLDNDSIMLCNIGNDFNHTYGHQYGMHHSNHYRGTSNEWMRHMMDEHQTTDRHFGSIDMVHNTFDYRFEHVVSSPDETIVFHGQR